MTDPDWKAELRRELDTAGEEQVRAELRGLSTGAEDRRLFIVGWLQEKEKARKAREAWFYWGSLVLAGLAFLVTVAGIIATCLLIDQVPSPAALRPPNIFSTAGIVTGCGGV
jgi:hypothetical protein